MARLATGRAFQVFLGIAQRILGLDPSEWLLKPVEVTQIGAISEQFVAQQIISQVSTTAPPELYYWHREEKGSTAEVDFLLPQAGNIIPVEVKSGKKGSLKSLHSYMESHPRTPYGVKISESPYQRNGDLLSLSFYQIEAWIAASKT